MRIMKRAKTNISMKRPEEVSPGRRNISTEVSRNLKFLQDAGFGQEFVDELPIFFGAIDHAGQVLMVNRTLCEFLGCEPEEIIGKEHIANFIPEFRQCSVDEIFAPFLDSGGPGRTENYLLARDGRRVLVEWHGQTVLGDGDEVDFVFAIGIDITSRRMAEEALKTSEERLKSLFEATFEGIVIHDGGRILDINATFMKMFGYSRAELLGRSIVDLAAPESTALMREKIISLDQQPYEVMGLRKDGSRISLEIIARYHIYRGRQVRVAAYRDISERKKAAEDLKETHTRLVTEQLTLTRKNIALKEILNQIENEKNQIKRRIQSNINTVINPLLNTLKSKLGPDKIEYVNLLEDALNDIASPFISRLEKQRVGLTPRELEICNMIKSGMTSKQIAAALDISSLTVDKQRAHIRRKLGLANKGVNLISYLKSN